MLLMSLRRRAVPPPDNLATLFLQRRLFSWGAGAMVRAAAAGAVLRGHQAGPCLHRCSTAGATGGGGGGGGDPDFAAALSALVTRPWAAPLEVGGAPAGYPGGRGAAAGEVRGRGAAAVGGASAAGGSQGPVQRVRAVAGGDIRHAAALPSIHAPVSRVPGRGLLPGRVLPHPGPLLAGVLRGAPAPLTAVVGWVAGGAIWLLARGEARKGLAGVVTVPLHPPLRLFALVCSLWQVR
jgi:hypothetical protein